MMYVFHEERNDDKAYNSRTLLLKLRVKTDDGHRVAVSGLEQSGQIIFPVLADKQQDSYTLRPGPTYHLYRQVFG